MVDPSRPRRVDEPPRGKPRKEGIRCDGTLKKGARRGEKCDGLVLGKDDLSLVCHNCGKLHTLLDLLNEVMERGYLGPEDVFAVVPSLYVQKGVRSVNVERGARYFAIKTIRLLNEVFGMDISGTDAADRFVGYNTACFGFVGNNTSILFYSYDNKDVDFAIVSETRNLAGHRFAIVSDEGIAIGLSVRVKNPEYFARAKRFAKRLETLTKRIQKTQSQVTVVQDF